MDGGSCSAFSWPKPGTLASARKTTPRMMGV